jgi:hypothetical protein
MAAPKAVLARCALLAALGALPRAAAGDPAMPPAGRSLFDFVTTSVEGERKVQRVPYPFGALLARLGEQLEGGEQAGVKSVLIPLGRSLQRDAAGGEFFRYPRVVAAVVGEPAAPDAVFLKDRLYLGFHEKAAMLEVISYNEAAGRFEFQVVRDYREGARPRVRYANRAMCLSCHQNAGPIFSRPPWDETNANPGLRKLLHAQKRDFYGIPIDLGAEVPNAIDQATDRANRLQSVQRLWREGCESAARPGAAARCRGAAFAAALKYRLSGDRQIDTGAQTFREALVPVLGEAWRARWPEGIALPSPDLPNRDPLEALGEAQLRKPAAGMLRRAARVTAEFDPLAPREPIDLRFGGRREDFEYFVRNLAGFLSEADVGEIDRWLEAVHERAGGATRPLRLPCRTIERSPVQRPTQMQFACMAPAGGQSDLALSGWLERQDARVLGGAFDRSPAARVQLRDVQILPAAIEHATDGSEVRLAIRQTGLRFRLADGSRVTQVTLRWSAATRISAGALRTGEAELRIADDFAPLERALEELADDSLGGRGDALSSLPFRRAALLKELHARLGMPSREWCCADDRGMPALERDADAGPSRGAAPLAPFRRACAACHSGPDAFPPGFLHGGGAAVLKSIDGCAERMLYRLAMWRVPEDARPKTPMPPLATARVADAALAADLRRIERYLAQRVAHGGPAPRPYEQLQRCLPTPQR